MSSKAFAAGAEPDSATDFRTSLFDRLPRELRDEIYKLVASRVRSSPGHEDTLELAHYKVSGLSHTSRQVRQEWHEVCDTEICLVIDLDEVDESTCPHKWLEVFGQSHIRRFWTFFLNCGEHHACIRLDYDSYDVEAYVDFDGDCGCCNWWRAPPAVESERQSIQRGILDVLDTYIQPDEQDGTYYMDCDTLYRVITGFAEGFSSPEYKYKCTQPGGLKKELPDDWNHHKSIADKENWDYWQSRPVEEKEATDWRRVPLQLILASIAKAHLKAETPYSMRSPLISSEVRSGDDPS